MAILNLKKFGALKFELRARLQRVLTLAAEFSFSAFSRHSSLENLI
jgi:hypothetical protein